MTVAQLIALLQKLPPDATIWAYSSADGCFVGDPFIEGPDEGGVYIISSPRLDEDCE